MFFFFKQKTAYEMRISDWSSDVCSSDLCWPSSLRQALSSWPELAQLAHVAPRRTPRAMFSDEVLEGDDIDLSRLPIQRCWPGDVGRLVTLGLVITRGTRKPRQNIGIYRMQVIGRDRVIMRWLPHREIRKASCRARVGQ